MPAKGSTEISWLLPDLDVRLGCFRVCVKLCFPRRVGGGATSFGVDMMPVKAATETQNTPSTNVVAASGVHQVIFSDPNGVKMDGVSDSQVQKALLTPAFSHR
ncbi:hypothetical protein QFZ60_001742 [Arthrobacter sp. B2I5]|nr:hypothetical protein [Arthrobacter sp. B2I5]